MTYGTNISVISLEWQKTTFHHNAPCIGVVTWDKHLRRRRHEQDLVKSSKNIFLADDKKQMIISTLEKNVVLLLVQLGKKIKVTK